MRKDIMAYQVTGNRCLFNSSFRPTSKKTSHFHIIDLCEGIEGPPTDSPQKVPIMRNAFPYHYVIMKNYIRAPIGYVIYGRADPQAKIVRNCEFICGALLKHQGADSIKRCNLTSIGNPIVEIRRSYDRLISTMGLPILVRWHLYIESGPRKLCLKVQILKLSLDKPKPTKKVQSNPKFWIYFVPKSIQTQWQLTEYKYITR